MGRRRASRKALAALLAAALIAPLGGCGGEEDGPESLFSYDAGQPLDAEFAPAPAIGGEPVKKVAYAGASGIRVPGFLALPPGADGGPCVIYLHGFGRSKDDATPYVEPLGRLGIGVLAIDAPFHGDRAARPRQFTDLLEDPQLFADVLRETVIDLRRGLDLLETRPECDPDRLGFIGFSFGALNGAMLAGADERVRSTVLLSAGADWQALLRRADRLYLSGKRAAAARERGASGLEPYAVDEWVGRIEPRALLLVSGRSDEVVPRASIEALHAAAGEGSAIVWYDGGHDPFAGPDRLRVGRLVEEFLRRTLVDAAPEAGP